MGDFSVRVEKITGRTSGSSACGVFTKRVSLSEGELGTLAACILVKSSASYDLQTVLGDIFELSIKKLEGAGEGILDSLLLSKNSAAGYARSKNLEASFIFTVFFEDVCYVARFGGDVRLLVFEPPKSVEITFESGSGPVSPGQIYLMATEKFLSIFDTGDLSREAEVDFREIIDGIAVEIAGEENQSEIGAAFITCPTAPSAPVEGGRVTTEASESKTTDTEEIATTEATELEPEGAEEPATAQKSEEAEDIGRATRQESVYSVVSRNPLPGIISVIIREFSKLRHGDIGAKLRLRRNVVLLAILVFAILAGSIVFAMRQKAQSEKAAEVEKHLSGAASKFNEGIALIELNKSRAREVLIVADSDVKQALALDSKNQKALELSSEITSKLKETEVTSDVKFESVVDVSSSIVSLSSSGKKLVGVSDGKIFVVDPSSKTSTDVRGVSKAARSALFDNKAFIENGQEVFRVDLATGQSKAIIERGGVNDIGVFLGNVYLLFADKQSFSSNRIDKYVPVEGGFSGPTNYLNNPMNFGTKPRFAIDGSVWVTSGRQIFKFTRGEKQSFEISGLISGAGEFGLIYTNASLDNLYVVDSTNSALLVISKDGVYKRAYQAPEFSKAAGIVVSDDETKMYVGVGSKILGANL